MGKKERKHRFASASEQTRGQLPSTSSENSKANPTQYNPATIASTNAKTSFALIAEKYFSLIFLLTIVSLVVLAWENRFVQDDAFISFRYADNFIRGMGLVWNKGEYIEGYTNFLWTLFISGGIFFGVDPAICSQFLGIGCFVGSLITTHKISRLIFDSKLLSVLTILLLGSNYTFSSYATGGLETQMQTMLCLTACYVCMEGFYSDTYSRLRFIALSLLCSAALLTRLDSILLCGITLITTMIFFWKRGGPVKDKLVDTIALLLPLIMIIGAWFLWKFFYYGNFLPNTFYIKASSSTSIERGFNYLYVFLTSYFLWPFLLVIVFTGSFLLQARFRPLGMLASLIMVWLLYVIKVGGDFMEFRLLVPILPALFILIIWVLFTVIHHSVIRTIGIGIIVTGTIYHAITFSYTIENGIEPIRDLRGHLLDQDKDWIGIGQALGRAFDYDPEVIIATTAAGAIPFYSRLQTVDMLGINDPWVARNGTFIGTTPGHQRIAPFSYLQERKVNLIISHPIVLLTNTPIKHFPLIPWDEMTTYSHLYVIEIPINEKFKFLALYLTPHPTVDKAIDRFHWNMHLVKNSTQQ